MGCTWLCKALNVTQTLCVSTYAKGALALPQSPTSLSFFNALHCRANKSSYCGWTSVSHSQIRCILQVYEVGWRDCSGGEVIQQESSRFIMKHIPILHWFCYCTCFTNKFFFHHLSLCESVECKMLYKTTRRQFTTSNLYKQRHTKEIQECGHHIHIPQSIFLQISRFLAYDVQISTLL